MINVLRKIWAVVGLLIFFVQLLAWVPFLIVGFLISRKAERPLIWVGHHIIAPVTLFCAGVWRKQHNRQVIQGKGPFVIISNHRSFLDILINAAAYPGIYKFLSKKEMTKIPVWGFIVGRLCILVDRKSPESRAQSMDRMRDALEKGYSILIYPEGRRNRTSDPVTPYYDGAFRLAAETGYPMAIMTLNDPRKYNDPRRGLDLAPGLVHVHWDLIEETAGVDIEVLKEKAKGIMVGHMG